MSSLAFQRRSTKKHARDGSRRKPSLTVDLNDPPPALEIRQAAETSAVAEAENATLELIASPIASPIDVEAIEDDDIQLLSSPREISQTRNRLRTRPVMVVIDEDSELSTGTSVINVDENLSSVPLSIFCRRQGHSSHRNVFNCESYVNIEDDHIAKRKKRPFLMEQETGVALPAAAATVLSCPICMSALSNACSTICGHVFCQSCIKQAIQSQKKCPTCRRKLKANNFHRIFLPTNT